MNTKWNNNDVGIKNENINTWMKLSHEWWTIYNPRTENIFMYCDNELHTDKFNWILYMALFLNN